LKKYGSDEKLKKILDQTKLIKFVPVFPGSELLYPEQLPG